MNLIQTSQHILSQLTEVLSKLDQQSYSKPLEILSNSSVGQHIRHIIEFFDCLNTGCIKGVVNYDQRQRNKDIEDNKHIALRYLESIIEETRTKNLSRNLILTVNYNVSKTENGIKIHTLYERELAYNIEHAIHHMAIIKIGIRQVSPSFQFPIDFGVAYSTIRYQQSICAQ